MGHVMRHVLEQVLIMVDAFVSPRGEVMSA